jgi:aminobenzoyl-glutamate utilization protein A
MNETVARDRLVDLRREFHRKPEPAWCEFWTTARIVAELERIGVDQLRVGPEILDDDSRRALPDEETLAAWLDRARETGADADLLDRLAGGYTGTMAVLERGEGPTVALRVDIDGLPITESDDDDHLPTSEGFASTHEGYMHACGHDAHTTIGLGVLETIANSDFAGTLKVLFQPAEEVIGGGMAVAESGVLGDVDDLLSVHVGLDHPTGEVVAGIDGFLSVRHFDVEFQGESAHAGGHPAEGRNAVQAMATAVQNMYAIPRNEDGATRVNAGKVGGGTATNVIPESAFIEGEVRGETTALMEYIYEKTERVVRNAAEMHDCEATVEPGAWAPSATSDEAVVDVVADVAADAADVDSLLRRDDLGGSEDATFLMERVQERGGEAAYVGVGTDHPGGHHTPTFDVDETTLSIGVEVLSTAVRRLASTPP